MQAGCLAHAWPPAHGMPSIAPAPPGQGAPARPAYHCPPRPQPATDTLAQSPAPSPPPNPAPHPPPPTAGAAEDIGRSLLVYGRRVPKAELFARIDAVDADTVKAVANRFFLDQEVAIAALGDTQFLPDLNWFRR